MKVSPPFIHRLFYPQVPLVMAAQYRGRTSAMPVVSYLSASVRPPMVGVACSPEGFTCKLALKARSFTLSLLDRSKADSMSALATIRGSKTRDKLEDAGLRYRRGIRVAAPVLTDALATLECSLVSRRKIGDHLLVVGRVEAAYATSAFTDSWDYTKYRPMLYSGWRGGLTLYPSDQP